MHGKLRILSGIVRTKLGMPTPIFCHWDITHNCNMRCEFCNVVKEKSTWMPELDTTGGLRIVDDLGRLGVAILNISGGEPLLRADLGRIISRAKQRGMIVFVATNGWFLTERIDQLRGADAVRVSLDGIGSDHDRVRGKGAYQRAVKGVKALKGARINVTINCVITNKTPERTVDGLCELAQSLGIQASFSPVAIAAPSGKKAAMAGVSGIVAALRIENDWFFSRMEEVRKRYPKVLADPPIIYRIIKEGGLEKYGCQMLRTTFDIKPDGSVVMPCGGWPVEHAKGDLVTIWKSEQMRRARKMVGAYDFCKGCRAKCHIFPSLLLNIPALIELGLTYRV